MGMKNQQEIAYELFMNLPWWKRAMFFKWYKSNNWDVKHIWEGCMVRAKFILAAAEYTKPENTYKP